MKKRDRIYKIDEKFIETIESGVFIKGFGSDVPFGISSEKNWPIPEYHYPFLSFGKMKNIGRVYTSPKRVLELNSYSDAEDISPYVNIVPYNVPMRVDILLYILKMALKYQNKKGYDNYQYFEDLKPVLEDYTRYFKEGFEGFMETEIKRNLRTTHEQEVATKIAKFLFDNLKIMEYTGGYYSLDFFGFATGLLEGKIYRAWLYVLSDFRFFEPIFKNLMDERNRNEHTEKKEGSKSLDISNIENHFDHKDIKETVPAKPQRNYTAKHHVISYILDCRAKDETLPSGKKTKIVEIAKQRPKYTGNENTFYKNFNDYANMNLNKEAVLINLIGDDWRSIVLELSSDKKTLKDYLDRHFV